MTFEEPLINLLVLSFIKKQYVSVDGIQSEIESITYGVAQESILGPLLFLLYINDLNNAENCLSRLFADDTSLLDPIHLPKNTF